MTSAVSEVEPAADAFGMPDDVVPGGDDQFDEQPDNPGQPKKKATGLPLAAWIGIGLMTLLVVAAIGSVLVRSQTSRTAVPEQQAAQAPASRVSQELAQMRNDLDALKKSVMDLQQAQQGLRGMVEQGAQSAEVADVKRRMVAVEGALVKADAAVRSISSRMSDARPMDADILLRGDTRIKSIGAGLARLEGDDGEERNVQKGDRWRGLIVREIRSDRRQVILSDGSVIQ